MAVKKGKQIPSRTYKVVFIKKTPLPVHFSKLLVLLEGIITVNVSDEETAIKDSLVSVLRNAGRSVSAEGLIFLSYVMKILSIPCVVPGFCWNGEQLKANIGQGKLYVMVAEAQVLMNFYTTALTGLVVWLDLSFHPSVNFSVSNCKL